MRQITQNAASAFIASQPFASGNTMVTVEPDNNAVLTKMFLHGNLIARKRSDSENVQTTLAGWPTPTTRERLNGLLHCYGFYGRYQQKNRSQLFDGRLINDCNQWINVAV